MIIQQKKIGNEGKTISKINWHERMPKSGREKKITYFNLLCTAQPLGHGFDNQGKWEPDVGEQMSANVLSTMRVS